MDPAEELLGVATGKGRVHGGGELAGHHVEVELVEELEGEEDVAGVAAAVITRKRFCEVNVDSAVARCKVSVDSQRWVLLQPTPAQLSPCASAALLAPAAISAQVPGNLMRSACRLDKRSPLLEQQLHGTL